MLDDEVSSAAQSARKRKPAPVDTAAAQRTETRPKRSCAQPTQQHMNRLLLTKKTSTTPAAILKPCPSPTKAAPSSPAFEHLSTASSSSTPPAEPTAAVAAPPPAQPAQPAAPYVPSTREETLALLQSLHSSLSLSAPPTCPSLIPSRTAQLSHIRSFLHTALSTRTPHALYVAGRPGVGKTLTVDLAVKALLGGTGASPAAYRCAAKKAARGSTTALPCSTVVSMNAVAVREGGGRFWVRLLGMMRWAARGKAGAAYQPSEDERTMGHDEALRDVQRFVRDKHARGEMILLVVDEIDALFASSAFSSSSPLPSSSSSPSSTTASSTGLLRSLLELIYSSDSCLVLVSISNSITLLDEHLSSLSASHTLPERVVFSTYSHADLLSILHERLSRHPTPSLPFFHQSALDLVTRSVGKDTGDVRRCLRDLRATVQSLIDVASSSAPFDAKAFEVTAGAISRVRSAVVGGGGGRVRELSHQQAGVLWVVGIKGGGRLAGLFECYRRAVRAVHGGLAELSEGELCSVVDVLESVGMLRKERAMTGARHNVRVDSAVTVDALRRDLRTDLWPRLWASADAVKRVLW